MESGHGPWSRSRQPSRAHDDHRRAAATPCAGSAAHSSPSRTASFQGAEPNSLICASKRKSSPSLVAAQIDPIGAAWGGHAGRDWRQLGEDVRLANSAAGSLTVTDILGGGARDRRLGAADAAAIRRGVRTQMSWFCCAGAELQVMLRKAVEDVGRVEHSGTLTIRCSCGRMCPRSSGGG